MAVALGGRVAEEIIYGEDEVPPVLRTTAAGRIHSSPDDHALRHERHPGSCGSRSCAGRHVLGRDIAAERDFRNTAATIDQEVSELVDVAYKRATKVLEDNRAILDELADMLVEQRRWMQRFRSF